MIPQNDNSQQESSSGLFTPRLATDPAYRFSFELSPEDLDRYYSLPPRSLKPIVVTDQNTGLQWRVRQAECGAGCFCDAEALPIENSKGFDSVPRPELDVEETEQLIATLMELAFDAAEAGEGEDMEAFTDACMDLEALIEGYDARLLACTLLWAAREIAELN